jgi:TonB family protein
MPQFRPYRSPLFLLVLFISFSASAQNLQEVVPSQAMGHAIKPLAIQYPPAAKMGRIQGEVDVKAMISAEGRVTRVQLVSGHPLLADEAKDAIRKLEFHPFLTNGAPVPVETTLRILFVLGPDAENEEAMFQKEIQCEDLLKANRFADADAPCTEARQISTKISSAWMKPRVYFDAGRAALQLKRPAEAVQDFQERLKLSRQYLSPFSMEWFDVHHDLAIAYRAAGQLKESDIQFKEAENAISAAHKELEHEYRNKGNSGDIQAQVNKVLRQTLQEHAVVLRQLNRAQEADKLEQEANTLQQ